MDLNIYDIIKGPVVSDKSQKISSNLKKLVLNVHPKSNKPMIKEAIEKIFNVKVDSINIIVRAGKSKKFGKIPFKRNLKKHAIITLKEGYTVDIFGHGVNPAVSTSNESK